MAGRLFFCLADAAGHGQRGAALWDRHGEAFDGAWAHFTQGTSAVEERLLTFAETLEAPFRAASDSACVILGTWTESELVFASFGYGNHALVRTETGPWWAEAEKLFGLKLGWLPGGRRELPRGCVVTALGSVDRLCLLTDGLLEDDHRDPVGTLAGLEALNRELSGLAFEDVMPSLLATAPSPLADDLAVVVLERVQTNANPSTADELLKSGPRISR